jgi:hypothetical protein
LKSLLASLLLCFFLLLISALRVEARERLSLNHFVEIQYRSLTVGEWRSLTAREFDGVGALQFHLDSNFEYRMIITVRKPFDLAGTLRVRMVTRTDGIALPAGSETGRIIFGPQNGCQANEERCRPLSLDDVGLVETRLDLEKARVTSIGAFTIRPFSTPMPITIRTRYFRGDQEIFCGSTVKKGWLIFGKRLRADGSPIDTISACGRRPNGKIACAEDQDYQVEIRANEIGRLYFSIWNREALEDQCHFNVVK